MNYRSYEIIESTDLELCEAFDEACGRVVRLMALGWQPVGGVAIAIDPPHNEITGSKGDTAFTGYAASPGSYTVAQAMAHADANAPVCA